MHEFEAAERHRDEHKDTGEEETDDEKAHIDNLLKAVEAADDQCKQLEYWSDVRDMARDGEILRASEHAHGWDHGWQGLDMSGPDPPGGSPSDSNSDNDEKQEKVVGKGKEPAREADDPDPQPVQVTEELDIQAGWEDQTAYIKQPDEFHSPGEEKAQDQIMPQITDGPSEDRPPEPERRESEITLERYESAHSEPDDDSDDTVTEKAPSEDEGDIEDTPPAGTTPVHALTSILNGRAKEEKGTASQQSK